MMKTKYYVANISGGKDSTVLMHIARNHWMCEYDIKGVFVDTGLEYPEIRQFVKTFDNVEIIRPKMSFVEVIKKNGFDLNIPKSTPMAFWTEQDVLEYIYKNNLPIAEPYGEVIETECQYTFDGEQCKYATTGCDRTGCMFCAFGAHLEKGKTRFQRLKETHPKQYNYCLNGGEFVNGLWQPNKQGLGMRYVFDELNSLYGDDFIRY